MNKNSAAYGFGVTRLRTVTGYRILLLEGECQKRGNNARSGCSVITAMGGAFLYIHICRRSR
jgi:hypothetical protein